MGRPWDMTRNWSGSNPVAASLSLSCIHEGRLPVLDFCPAFSIWLAVETGSNWNIVESLRRKNATQSKNNLNLSVTGAFGFSGPDQIHRRLWPVRAAQPSMGEPITQGVAGSRSVPPTGHPKLRDSLSCPPSPPVKDMLGLLPQEFAGCRSFSIGS